MKSIWKKKLQISSKGPQIYEEINKKLGLNNVKMENQPHLTISEWCHKHIRDLHKEYPKEEWLALCKVEKRWPMDFVITDMIHPEQNNSSGSVTATEKWMEWAVEELKKRWEDLGLWNCVLHSHHSMWVFWSGTDDNARKELNDWRFMAFAVVTAYSWTWNLMSIDYKGCVNFYKPYPIEIDCDMYYEEWELDKWYDDYIDEYTKIRDELFEKKIKARQNEINGLYVEPDYTKVIDYLGEDISSILKENYDNVVVRKLPNPQAEAIIKTCENEAKIEAEEKMKENDELMSGMKEYLDWSEWSWWLEKQLEEHIVKPYAQKVNSRGDYSKIMSQSNRVFTDIDDLDYTDDRLTSDFFFSSMRYPTSYQLRNEMGLKPDVSVQLVNWIWKVFSKSQGKYVWADDFDYDEDWDSCLWSSEDDFFTWDKEKKEKKEKSVEEQSEDVLHWLYN